MNADFTLECYTERWTKYALVGVFFVLLYPIGVPVFFLAVLRRYRARFDEAGVRLQLGFLYAAYNDDSWCAFVPSALLPATLSCFQRSARSEAVPWRFVLRLCSGLVCVHC